MSETLSMTLLMGLAGPRPVITRSMVERAIRQDGIKRVLALAELNMRGRNKIYDISSLLHLVPHFSYFCSMT